MCRRYRARAASEFNLLFRIVCLAVNRVLFESALKGSLNHHGHFRLLPANFAELLSAEFPQILKLAAVPDARRILPSTERARPNPPCNHRRKDEARVKRGVRSFVRSFRRAPVKRLHLPSGIEIECSRNARTLVQGCLSKKNTPVSRRNTCLVNTFVKL